MSPPPGDLSGKVRSSMRALWQGNRLKRGFGRFGLVRLACLVMVFAMAALRLANVTFLEQIRLQAYDAFQLINPRNAVERPVVIVDIDEASLDRFGQWPWPRTLIADLVAALTAKQPLVIGFDMIFSEPDRLSPGIAAGGFRNLSATTRESLLALPGNDEILADEIGRSVVVLGESGFAAPNRLPTSAPPPPGLVTLGEDPRPFLLKFPGLLSNLPVLSQASAGRGLLTVRSERDGILRRVPMVLEVQGETRPSLTLEMVRVVAGADTLLIKADATGIKSVTVKNVEVPTDRNGQLWVHFGQHDPKRFVSAVDVLSGKVEHDAIAGKLVLIGTSAVGLLDVKTTPVAAVMAGVEIHAQILESILDGDALVEPQYGIVIELLIAIGIGIAVIVMAPLFTPLSLLVCGILVAVMVVGASWQLYAQSKILIDFTYPLISTFLVYILILFSSYFKSQLQRQQIRLAFGRYLSPVLVEQLAQSPEKLVLGGEQREMTIMFTDVRGFTGISESYKDDPQGLTALMNRFLTPLTNAILAHGGTVDKYMGDAILAFWNAPLDDPAHQIHACEAALEMLECIEALNRERESEAAESGKVFLPLNVGVGINTGICVVGNMGSDLRFDYSVLGDTVNLASRLEGQSKVYGFRIIIGSATAKAVQSRFANVEIDCIAVKGRQEPEVIYAVVGRSDLAESEWFLRLKNLMLELLTQYRSRNWDIALQTISRGRALDGSSAFSAVFELYESRINDFIAAPPELNWDGVAILQQK